MPLCSRIIGIKEIKRWDKNLKGLALLEDLDFLNDLNCIGGLEDLEVIEDLEAPGL